MSIGNWLSRAAKPVLPRGLLNVKRLVSVAPAKEYLDRRNGEIELRSEDRYLPRMSSPHFKQIGIIGTGRVARALTLGLIYQSVAPIMVWGRTLAKCRELVEEADHARIVCSLAKIVAGCDVIAIAVSDDAIPEIVQAVSEVGSLCPGALVFHVSGRKGIAVLEPLLQMSAQTAAIHPAMTFTGEPKLELERMNGSRFAVTGSSPESVRLSQLIVDGLGGIFVEVPKSAVPFIMQHCVIRRTISSPCSPVLPMPCVPLV